MPEQRPRNQRKYTCCRAAPTIPLRLAARGLAASSVVSLKTKVDFSSLILRFRPECVRACPIKPHTFVKAKQHALASHVPRRIGQPAARSRSLSLHLSPHQSVCLLYPFSGGCDLRSQDSIAPRTLTSLASRSLYIVASGYIYRSILLQSSWSVRCIYVFTGRLVRDMIRAVHHSLFWQVRIDPL